MDRFHQDIQRIKNLPINLINSQVIDFMTNENYNTYAQTVYPFNRTVHIYGYNHKMLVDFFDLVRPMALFNNDSANNRNEILLNVMAHIHNYLSSQYALLQILEVHANQLPMKKQLLSQFNKLKKVKVTDFVGAFRNNIIHQTNFSISLRFESKWGHNKIVYPVSELLKSSEWSKSRSYISTFTDHLIIEDVIGEYHNHVKEFLDRYEIVLYEGNTDIFKEVLTTLLSFAKQYKVIGQQGFLPVSEKYLNDKLKFYPD